MMKMLARQLVMPRYFKLTINADDPLSPIRPRNKFTSIAAARYNTHSTITAKEKYSNLFFCLLFSKGITHKACR